MSRNISRKAEAIVMRSPPIRKCFLYVFFALVSITNVMWIVSSYWLNRRLRHNAFNVTYRENVTSAMSVTIRITVLAEKPVCSAPDKLVGVMKMNMAEMIKTYHDLNASVSTQSTRSGGFAFEPDSCKPKLSVAIIIPFRDREDHLKTLLGHLHPILLRQNLRFQVFVVEQSGNGTFNKGRLMNTGFLYAKNEAKTHFDCYIFHDVDMLPEDDRNLYSCETATNRVYHLSCSVSKFNYKPLCCGMTVGGVLSFSENQYIKVNGFPNDYWGWGGEDDDMNSRIKLQGLRVGRPALGLCRYYMIEHERDHFNPYTENVVNDRVAVANQKAKISGLNNLKTNTTSVTNRPLYTHLYVDVGPVGE
ncbi:beta-1,4-galactosyltransferase 2-like isoform X2 [Clavelina lepadiformis]|uniref:beta-1,4-galactosyltransferase 2-like isoform X2 n=1 Tax=Clavelina lepadiformis TaxID=159417 RepID=UPI0040429402